MLIQLPVKLNMTRLINNEKKKKKKIPFLTPEIDKILSRTNCILFLCVDDFIEILPPHVAIIISFRPLSFFLLSHEMETGRKCSGRADPWNYLYL